VALCIPTHRPQAQRARECPLSKGRPPSFFQQNLHGDVFTPKGISRNPLNVPPGLSTARAARAALGPGDDVFPAEASMLI